MLKHAESKDMKTNQEKVEIQEKNVKLLEKIENNLKLLYEINRNI